MLNTTERIQVDAFHALKLKTIIYYSMLINCHRITKIIEFVYKVKCICYNSLMYSIRCTKSCRVVSTRKRSDTYHRIPNNSMLIHTIVTVLPRNFLNLN